MKVATATKAAVATHQQRRVLMRMRLGTSLLAGDVLNMHRATCGFCSTDAELTTSHLLSGCTGLTPQRRMLLRECRAQCTELKASWAGVAPTVLHDPDWICGFRVLPHREDKDELDKALRGQVLEHLHATGAVVRRAEVMLEATDSEPDRG